MGQTARTTKLLLDLSTQDQGGTNPGKRSHLTATVIILDAARRFYLAFFLAHPDKLMERVEVISKKTGEVRAGVISADNLLTWAECQTVETADHPTALPDWNFSRAFPDLPNRYRRSVIKDVIGKPRGYITSVTKWHPSGKKKRKPGIPTASNHPTLYAGTFALELDELAVDLNVKQLAVITVRQHGMIKETRFVSDHGLDHHRFEHLKRVAKKQWQAGKAVKGEHSNQQLWAHVRRQNRDCAHQTARAIVEVCEKYPGCVLVFERLRKIKPSGGSKSRRLNRKQANQLRGKINQLAKEKAYTLV